MPNKLNAMLLCDGAMVVGGKATVQGIFDNIMCPLMPTILSPFTVFVRFHADLGPHELKVRMVNILDQEIFFAERAAIVRNDGAYECAVPLPGLPIAEYGVYDFRFYIDDVWVGEGISLNVFKPVIQPPESKKIL